ncbi:uncharacterized protein LOC143369266 isoform X2 [Andrena cerasifolii]|uniref:uncharacterized protein LOC143369266 isoform X2 n=1 Tax=Andrena cerasifolii TaxID=2819439 RepID=UPI004037DBAD
MDESAKVPQKADAKALLRSPGVDPDTGFAYLKVADCSVTDEAEFPKAPKRKLSVFCRSFDVITAKNQGDTVEFRRTSSSPSVRIEKEQETESRSDEFCQRTSLCKKGFVNSYRSLIESGKFLSGSSADDLIGKFSPSGTDVPAKKAEPLQAATLKLPQVREGKTGDAPATIAAASIGKHFKSDSSGSGGFKCADERVAVDSRESRLPSEPDNFSILINDASPASGEPRNDGTSTGGSRGTPPAPSSATFCGDLAKIKDSAYPRALAGASSAGRLGKYTSVDLGMSSHGDSSIGSDSDDEPIERVHCASNGRPKGDSPTRPSPFYSTGALPKKPDSGEPHGMQETGDHAEFHSTREKRQRLVAARRSLSEGDCERCHVTRRRRGCAKPKESPDEQEEKILGAFPSFTDVHLQAMGLSSTEGTDTLHRETLLDTEVERKYIAFSIGLGIDRITLHRRLSLSRRNRDLAERNLAGEIQQMHGDIEQLLPLCTDKESIEKVERVRHRLDMVMRCAHKVSCAAETLGAVCQEQRITRAIFVADKYLQTLRSRCELLATEIAEAKRILLENNIVIDENSAELGDDLPKIRYKNGLPFNNRVARRRASIATISRPLTSQDTAKEGPKQRNSVCGRVTLRRPSLCSEIQKWEYVKPNRTDFNSVVELRDIFEQTESRRNSNEENNNSLRDDQGNNNDTVNPDVASQAEDEARLISAQNSLLELDVTKTVEKQSTLCTRTAESLRILENFKAWQQMLWYALIFFLGFYTKHVISSMNVCDRSPKFSVD